MTKKKCQVSFFRENGFTNFSWIWDHSQLHSVDISAFFYHTDSTWIHSVDISEFMLFIFYVKSILKTVEVRKTAIFQVSEALNFVFGKIQPSKIAENHQNLILVHQKLSKWEFLELLKSQKLISRKFRVTEKISTLWNMYVSTVKIPD